LRILENLNNKSDIIFLDETGFNNYQIPLSGWAPRGSGPIKIEGIK
jgi:hypothetical protein